jgi:hypothetical protein
MLDRFCEKYLVPMFKGKDADDIFFDVLIAMFLGGIAVFAVGGILYGLFYKFDPIAWSAVGFFAIVAGISYLISRCVKKHKSGDEKYGSRGWD